MTTIESAKYSVYKVEEEDDAYYVDLLNGSETNIRDVYSPKQSERNKKVLNELKKHWIEHEEALSFIYEYDDEFIMNNPIWWDEFSKAIPLIVFNGFRKLIFYNKSERFDKVKETLRKKRISLSQYRVNQLNKMRHIKQAL